MNTFRQIPRYIIRLLLLTVLAVVAMSVGAFLAWMGWNALFSAISLMIPALRDPNVQITRGNVSQSVGLFIGQGGLIFALSLGAGVSLALTHWFTSLRSMVPLRNWLFASALGFLIATPFGLNFLAAFGGTPGWGADTEWLPQLHIGYLLFRTRSYKDSSPLIFLMATTLPLVVGGVIVGVSQWLLLRLRTRRAWWWIVGNSLAFSSSPLGASWLMSASRVPTEGDYMPLLLTFFPFASCVVGLITGAVLLFLVPVNTENRQVLT